MASTHYTYYDLDSHENIIMYMLTDELMHSTVVDPLRKEFGFDVGINTEDREALIGEGYSDDTSSEGRLGMSLGVLSTNTDDLRKVRVVQMSTNSRYIEKMELNPARLLPFRSNTLLPNYSVPIRLYANEETSRGDKFWRTLFTGGTYADQEFAGLIDNSTIFHDYMFSFANSYPLLYSKINQLEDDNLKINTIQSKYNSHNVNIQDYQNWIRTVKSPLLIPSYYVFQTIDSGYDQMSKELRMYTALSAAKDPFGVDPEGLKLKIDNLNDIYTGAKGKSYLESIYFPTLRTKNFIEETKNKVINSQKNLIFTHEYYSATEGVASSLANTIKKWPYYNEIKFPRHMESSSPIHTITLETSADGLNREAWFIRNAIASNGFSAKFIESLKDVYEGGFGGLRMSPVSLNVEKSYNQTKNKQTTVRSEIQRNTYNSLDLMKMLQTIYNKPSASINSNFLFVGPHSEGYETTYEDSGLYRYHDNQNLIGTMDDIFRTVKDKFDFSGIAPWSYFSTTGGGGAPSGTEAASYEATTSGYAEEAAKVLGFLFNPSFDHVETLAYRVDKIGGLKSQDYNVRENIQTFWIFNSENAGDNIHIYDNQIRYDENYTYKVSAYVAVMGIRYKYGDFRLSHQVATLDSGWDGEGEGLHIAPDGNPEYYCLQFYEPFSGELAEQFYNIGGGLLGSPGTPYSPGITVHDSLLDETGYADDITIDTSALATRNQLATNAVDLSVHPQIADFMYYFEPCLKLIEIPLFSKTIKVLDNPANDMISIPFQYLDASRKIGFNMRYENFNENRTFPVPISTSDRQRRLDYLNSRDLLPTEHVPVPALAQQRFIEVYRTMNKPTSLGDFEGKLVDTIDLKIKDSYYTFPDAMYKTTVRTNQKYYYVFRFLTENLMPGHLSQIIECELVEDGDYIYSLFNVLADELGEVNTLTKTSKELKKIFELQPNISQLTLDTRDVNFTKTAEEEINKLIVGISDHLIWDKVFKIRITSKKTGKQIDLNVEYNLKDENRVNVERGDALVRFTEVTDEELFLKLSHLTGLTTFAGDARDYSTRPGFSGYYVSYTGADLSDGEAWTYPWELDDES